MSCQLDVTRSGAIRRVALSTLGGALLLISFLVAGAAPSSTFAREITVDSLGSDQPWGSLLAPAAQDGSQGSNPLAAVGTADQSRNFLFKSGGTAPNSGSAPAQDAAKNPTPAPKVDAPKSDPARVDPSSRGGPRPNPDISTPDKFIAAVAVAAQESQKNTKVPPSVTVAQAILESDWGKSLLSKKANNYFGIKASKAPGPAGVISMDTWEVFGGQNVTVRDAFKAYNNIYESVADHGRFLADNPRYAAAFRFVNDAQEFARRIHAAGYATDPAYSTKLINLMNRFNLYQYNQAP